MLDNVGGADVFSNVDAVADQVRSSLKFAVGSVSSGSEFSESPSGEEAVAVHIGKSELGAGVDQSGILEFDDAEAIELAGSVGRDLRLPEDPEGLAGRSVELGGVRAVGHIMLESLVGDLFIKCGLGNLENVSELGHLPSPLKAGFLSQPFPTLGSVVFDKRNYSQFLLVFK